MGNTAAAALQEQQVDAYRTTGTSPTHVQVVTPPANDAVHLLGPGAVGREVLRLLARTLRRLVAVSDSTGTLHDPRGLDPLAMLQWKESGHRISDHPGALAGNPALHLEQVHAGIVLDTTATDLDRAGWTDALGAALARGACVALAAKAALCEAGPEWLTGAHADRIGCNAVLGGTGRTFLLQLPELRRRTQEIAIAGNASTTAIIAALESGATFAEGVAQAQRLGFLEPDPELDLRGTDAALKLAIAAGIVTGRRIDPRTIPCDDIRDLDPVIVRDRVRRDATTRLVARLAKDGAVGVRYEEVSRHSVLAVQPGRVIYQYALDRGERRIHIGSGLGAAATAAAVLADVNALAARTRTGAA